MSKNITFGTSGHRGIINDTFTHEHVQAIANAIAQHLHTLNIKHPTLLIGYDPRTGNDPDLSDCSFTKTLVTTLLDSGISVQFCSTFTPTPALSYSVPQRKLNGGIMLTASHNPPEYNGLKFNTPNGAPASIAITSEIERIGNTLFNNPPTPSATKGVLKNVSIIEDFTEHLAKTLSTIFNTSPNFSNINIAIDAKHGACGTTWRTLQKTLNIKSLEILHENPVSNFGNISPNPSEKELFTLKNLVQNKKADIGIGNDPDGDRHAILDENGNWISPEEVTIIIAEYLKQTQKPIHGIATTLASSALIKTWCEANQIAFYETAVGFKYFTPYLEQSKTNSTRILAVESSGGFSLSDHTLEKCGFLPGLLLISISIETNTSLSKLKENILKKYGIFHFQEDSLSFKPEKKDQILSFLKSPSQNHLENWHNPVQTHSTLDGLKLIFQNNDWILARASGTEPLLRIYTETSKKESGKILIQRFKNILNEI